jgi:hypothetical protein
MRYVPISAEKVEQLKKQAKRLQRKSGGKHAELLDRVARGAGFDHWHHVTQCLQANDDLEGMALLRSKIVAFQKLAAEGQQRVEVTGPEMISTPFVMFAAEGDAWLLDPRQQECMCLAFHGEPIPSLIQGEGPSVTMQFHGSYRIEGDTMHFDTALPQVGIRAVMGFPVDELQSAINLATESFEDKFLSVFGQVDAVTLTPELIDTLLEKGFGDFDRAKLTQAAKDGARYSPGRNSLLYPPVAG